MHVQPAGVECHLHLALATGQLTCVLAIDVEYYIFYVSGLGVQRLGMRDTDDCHDIS